MDTIRWFERKLDELDRDDWLRERCLQPQLLRRENLTYPTIILRLKAKMVAALSHGLGI